MNKTLCKTVAILLLALALIFALAACDKDDSTPHSVVATFELNENDGADSFTMRKGVIFKYKQSKLNSINGVEATVRETNKDKKIELTVKNVNKDNLSAVLAAIAAEPTLRFMDFYNIDGEPLFLGNGNIASVAVIPDNLDNPAIQIEFTAQGVENINRYVGRHISIYSDNEYITDAVVNVMLASGGAKLSFNSGATDLEAQAIAAKMNAALFGLQIKNLDIKYVG